MIDPEDLMGETVPTLATMAKTHKSRFTRASKALLMSVTSLKANEKSQHFFDEVIKAQDLLRERHESLVEIYTAIEKNDRRNSGGTLQQKFYLIHI